MRIVELLSKRDADELEMIPTFALIAPVCMLLTPSLRSSPSVNVLSSLQVTQFTFANLGGPGRFRVIPEANWPNSYSEAPTDMAQVGPFEVREL